MTEKYSSGKPSPQTNNASRLAGKYADRIPENPKGVDHSEAREAAMLAAIKERQCEVPVPCSEPMGKWLVNNLKDWGELELPDRKELDKKARVN